MVKSAEPRLNLGIVLIAALLTDVVLWLLVILGFEAILAPQSAGSARFFSFVFPYSHSLVASLIWSGLFAYAVSRAWPCSMSGRGRAAALVFAAVFSHFLLDLIVHVPDLPLAGADSLALGLGLWRHMPIALGLELTLAAAALWGYLRLGKPAPGRKLTVGALVVLAGLLTVAGPYAPGELPPLAFVAASSLVALSVVVAAGFAMEGTVAVTSCKDLAF